MKLCVSLYNWLILQEIPNMALSESGGRIGIKRRHSQERGGGRRHSLLINSREVGERLFEAGWGAVWAGGRGGVGCAGLKARWIQIQTKVDSIQVKVTRQRSLVRSNEGRALYRDEAGAGVLVQQENIKNEEMEIGSGKDSSSSIPSMCTTASLNLPLLTVHSPSTNGDSLSSEAK